MTLLTKPEEAFNERVDNYFFPTNFPTNNRTTKSQSQFPVGTYHSDERCGDSVWNCFHDPPSQSHIKQMDDLSQDAKVSKNKLATTLGQQFESTQQHQHIPWSNASSSNQRPIIKMNSDSSLDSRLLVGQNPSRSHDSVDTSSIGCFNVIGAGSGEQQQFTIWSGYQQNINSNRTISMLPGVSETTGEIQREDSSNLGGNPYLFILLSLIPLLHFYLLLANYSRVR